MAKTAKTLISGGIAAGILVAAAGVFFVANGEDTPQRTVPQALLDNPALLQKACVEAANTNLTGFSSDAAIKACVERGTPQIKIADNIPAVCSAFSSALMLPAPKRPDGTEFSAIELAMRDEVKLPVQAGLACSDANAPNWTLKINMNRLPNPNF